ncbi:putative reverse transcriptase domain-containing protein, partial [Tanacetum coccineum]
MLLTLFFQQGTPTPPSPPAHRTTTRISIRPEAPVLLPSEEEVERFLALPPPPSPLILLPPSAEERLARCLDAPVLPSSPLPTVPHPYGSPNHVRAPSCFRAAMGRLRASSPSTHYLLRPSPPLPPPPSSLHLSPPVTTSPLPPLPDLLFIAPVDQESSTAVPRPTGGRRVDYGFVGTLDAEARRQRAETVGYGIRDTWVDPREATEEIAPDRQTQIYQTVEALVDDRQYHHKTARLLDREALVSQEAWVHSMGLSSAVHYELQGYKSHTWMHDHREIRALQAREQARVDAPEGTASTVVGLNNMPPKRTFVATRTARVAAATATTATTAAPMTTAAIEQLVTDRVSAALANHDTLRNSTNGHGDGSHNSGTGIRGTTRTPLFHISNCALENQVKFATFIFIGNALTWWNSHKKAVTQDVKGTDIPSYTLRFQELALMCGRMFPEESDEVEKYVGGLPDMIRGNVMSYRPQTMEEAIEFANDQMDQKLITISERQAEQKRKMKFNAGNNQGHQQQNKRQNTGRAYTAGSGEKREYTGSSGPNNNNNNRGNSGATQNAVTCYECGVQGHIQRDCPKLKNRNRGNQHGNNNAPAKVYVVGNARINPDSNVVTGTFLLNDRYTSILFDTSVDRSFVSTTFSSLIDITPTTLDHYYDVELADGKIIRINTIIRGCTLNLLNHPFNINLMPVELGSFDVIVGMDWLAKYHAVIDCAEKIVRIPWGNETLIVHGDGSNQGNGTRLNIISCTKTHKYLLKGHHVFLANVTSKETEDRS